MMKGDDLPIGWAKVRLAEIISPRRERLTPDETTEEPFIGMEHVEAHSMTLLGTVPAKSMKSSANRFTPGDVLYGRLRPYLNKVHRPTFAGLCSAEFIVLPDTAHLISQFLQYRVNAADFVAFASHLDEGDRPRVDFDQIGSFVLKLPPVEEQHRIVAKVEELVSDLDSGVSALKRAQANLKRYRAAVLKSAVTGELTADWRAAHPNVEPATKLLDRILAERRRKWGADQEAKFAAAGKTPPKNWREKFPGIQPPDTSSLPSLPDGWCWASVEQLGAVQLGRQRSPKNRSDKHPTKYIRAANITEDGLALDDLLDMEFTPAEQETYRLHAGDIVLSEASGSPDQAGKPAVWNDEVPNCCFQNTVIRLRPETVSNRYFLVVFRHFYFNKIFARVAAGVGINHLSAAKFAALTVPLPPLLEQDIIVSEVEQRLSIIEATKNYIAASLKRAARLRQSILKEAFAGRLVPQDPNDEPASVLLERIRASSVSQNGQAKPRTRKPRPSNRPL